MKIGILLPGNMALTSAGNGSRVAAARQADALVRAGHEVVRLEPWHCTSEMVRELDLVHFYVGAFPLFGIEGTVPVPSRQLVMQPIIDSNEPFWRYRMAAALNQMVPGLYTIPGVMRRQAKSSALVLARSVHERQRLVRGLGIDASKVEIVLHGAEPAEKTDPDSVRRRFQLPERFLLHVSTYGQERKNVVRLIEAVGPTGLPLLIAGTPEPSPNLDRVRERAARYGVKLLGFQDRATLNSLYAACRVFCLPSAHEGAGLAAMDAATYGAGIVITRNGGPPDYFLDLAQYVNPSDVSDIRRAVLAAWANPRGEELKRRMAQLSWDETTQSLLRAYQKHLKLRV